MIRLLAVHQGGGIGGAPVSLLKLLRALDRGAFDGEAIFTEPGDVLGFAHDLGVQARVVPTGGALYYSAHARLEPRGLARFIRTFPSAVRTASAVLRHTRPDVLHLNTSVLLAWAAAARRARVPVVWVVREVLGPYPPLRRWQASYIRSHARCTVAISGAVRSCFATSAAVEVVYNAVDLAEFSTAVQAERTAVRAELNLAPTDHALVMIGSVQRVKGHWLMLDALERITAAQTRLVLVTGGHDAHYARSSRGRLKRALGWPLDNLDALLRDARHRGLEERIRVTGFRRDIARVLSAADVLVFPSLEPEGFGRPIIEAMAMARPVVATDVGPSRELLGSDAGRLVPPRADAVAEAIGELLRSPEECARLGQAGRARVEACFGLERQVAAMTKIYRQAARSA